MKMAIAKAVLVAAAALVVSACGAPGHEFIGVYSQNGTVTFTASTGENLDLDLSGNVNVMEGSSSDLVFDDEACTLPFNSDHYESAIIVPASTCRLYLSGGYVFALKFTDGSANLNGKTVNEYLTGSFTFTAPDGGKATGTFDWNSTLTKLSK